MDPNFPIFIGMVEIITAEMVSVRENSSQQNSQKQYLLRFFLQLFGYKTYVKIYLIRTEILSVINSRESGFSRILGARDISGAIQNAERTWIWNPDWEVGTARDNGLHLVSTVALRSQDENTRT
jgi:hypothetical protein